VRSARPPILAFALVVTVASAAVACEDQAIMQPHATPDPPEPVAAAPRQTAAPPAASQPDWHKNDQNPDNRAGQFAWDNVDPKFVSAIAGYGSDLRQMVGQKIDAAAVSRCLKNLGEAIATVPRPAGVDVRAAGEKIKDEASKAAIAPPAAPGAPSPQKESIKAALTIASATFAELGRSSYKVEAVVSGTRDLDEALSDITPLGALESHQNEIYRSLQRVEPVLRALQTEAAKRPARAAR
jgi:hypothetical protein